ncbi:MAG: hypothetical protein IJ746_04730, partial [Ruminococcus sp.]|nr:hypothetical protein [Ruminococcus sp.]
AGKTYTLTETGAPQGYAYSEDITFTVEKDGTVKVDGADVNGKVVMKDEALNVKISKTDITGDNEIGGAHIVVTDSQGNTVDEWDSVEGESHDIGDKLTAGETYTLTETGAPDGYAYAEDITFTVEKDGTVKVDGQNVNGKVVMKDDVTKVTISKLNNGSLLAGAELQILDKNKRPVANTTFTSGTTVKEFNGVLVAGEKYYLHEIKAPAGCNPAEDVEFTVNADGTVTEVEMIDTDLVVKISKTDMGGTEIEGATLQIWKGDDLIEEWESTNEAHTVTAKLEAGETYTLIETNAPEGYAYTEEQEFTVNRDGTVTEVTMKDDVTKIRILKKDSVSGDLITESAAVFQILSESGEVVLDNVTTNNGEIVINGQLNANTKYFLHEVTPPEGYEVNAIDVEFTYTDKTTATGTPVLEVEMLDDEEEESSSEEESSEEESSEEESSEEESSEEESSEEESSEEESSEEESSEEESSEEESSEEESSEEESSEEESSEEESSEEESSEEESSEEESSEEESSEEESSEEESSEEESSEEESSEEESSEDESSSSEDSDDDSSRDRGIGGDNDDDHKQGQGDGDNRERGTDADSDKGRGIGGDNASTGSETKSEVGFTLLTAAFALVLLGKRRKKEE